MMKRTNALRETKSAYRTRRAPARQRGVAKRAPKAQLQKEIVIHKIGVEGKPITYRVPNREWLPIIERDDALYEKYARRLEAEHKGEFVAIGLSGELILSDDMDKAGIAALRKFGPRQFALRRIGFDAEITSL